MACSPCGSGILLPSLPTDACILQTEQCGISNLYIALCDTNVAALDQATIDQLKTDGKLVALPEGFVEISEPAQTVKQVTKCGKEVVTRVDYTVTYKTYQSTTGIELDEYFKAIKAAGSQATILYQDCAGKWVINQELALWKNAGSVGTIPSQPLGISASFSKIPYRSDEDGDCIWAMEMKFRHNDVLCRTLLDIVI